MIRKKVIRSFNSALQSASSVDVQKYSSLTWMVKSSISYCWKLRCYWLEDLNLMLTEKDGIDISMNQNIRGETFL